MVAVGHGKCFTGPRTATQAKVTDVTFMMLLDENALHAFLPSTAINIGSKQKCYNLVCVCALEFKVYMCQASSVCILELDYPSNCLSSDLAF